METSQRFEQAARLWHLATSADAKGLQTALLSKEETVSAVLRKLLPEEAIGETVVGHTRLQRDLSAESKARVLVRIADTYRTPQTLTLLHTAVDNLLNKWKRYAPEFQEAIALLTELEGASWKKISIGARFHEPIKTQLLKEYKESAWSHDFIVLSRWWKHQDMVAAQSAFSSYLVARFNQFERI
jgi:hypothetical protein